MKQLGLTICLLCLIACGGSSPTSPSVTPTPIPAPTPSPTPPPAPQPLDLGGQWGGSLSITLDGTAFSRGVLVNIFQDATHLTGNYDGGENGQKGSLDLMLSNQSPDATITGSVGVDGPSSDPSVRCHGTGQVTGTARPFVIRALVVPLVNCGGAITNVTLTLTR